MAANEVSLYVTPGTEYSASINPECLQVLTYLKLCPKKVNIIATCHHMQSPSGVFPTLVMNGLTYSGSDKIITQLKGEFHDIDSSITDTESSDITAFSALLNDRFQHALMYLHWLDGKNYTEVTRKWIGEMTVFPLTLYVLYRTHRIMKHNIKQITSTSTPIEQIGYELVSQAEETLNLLAAKLGDNKYFYGNNPCSFDALVYGYLDIIYQYHLPGNDQLRNKLNSLSILTQYCTRMRQLAFPEIKSRHVSMATIQRPLIPLYKDPTVWLCVGVASTLLLVQGIRVGLLKHIISNLKDSM